MKDPTDTRDIGPRRGSPLWGYLAGVTLIGTSALVAALFLMGPREFAGLLHEPLFWILAVLVVFGELRPVVTPGSHAMGGATTSTMFAFAALLHFGLPTAALLQAVAIVVSGIVTRKAWFRVAFNAAQLTLGFAAASGVLRLAGIRPDPAAPWVPSGRDIGVVLLAGVAYFLVTDLLVCGAVALHERRPVWRVVRATLGYQSLVHLALLGLAPVVVVVMHHSSALVPLFVAPIVAVYFTAALSVRRDHQAMHDPLTGLPNRKLLALRAAAALEESRGRVGLFLLDLNRFKEVNDTLGHPVGDRLLQLIAHRLTHSVRPGDVVARLGGDEFAVLLPSVRDEAAAREVAARLRAALAEPVRLEGMTFDLDASVGIVLHPDHAPDFDLMIQRADVAMYLAKESRTGVETYAPDKDRNSPARLHLLGDLRRGLDRGEVVLHYQPKVRLADRVPVGVEALVRWRHPDRGMVWPDDFVPLAEQSYLMRLLTQHVVDQALEQAARWWENGWRVPVSINVSARDLLDTGLPEVVEKALERHDVPSCALLLEVGERVLMTGQAYTAETVRSLARMGVTLALDDFGTGYSSLVRLQRLPVSEVKIDRSFVGKLRESADDARVVRSLVDLARSLGVRSVAEGVEDAETARTLREMGCDAAQGRWFGEPLPADEATLWLKENLGKDESPMVLGGYATQDRLPYTAGGSL
ncbi:putative bifunctional diguanylate cyclase/phosphodiesterase [Bailinhaonella thermotolerans]|uniref:Bifunctional diguanylate cyclase/phosphodiesterase n=1 Tax=Bailinhaonella thermotolerans TaxID=1070861 RepID=A0A3A4AEB0_9ACTN|nr:bifunctional diguanylate cyclase/phosphodiesterase [Bailinhaonella thermotolerans]RJL25097.1 bifunctional diguanylate cyclase/phosphodiesterase [Bailinhaonella thermotolerans]